MGRAAYKKKIKVCATEDGTYLELPASSASLNRGDTILDDTVFNTEGKRSRLYGLRDWSVSTTCQDTEGDDAIALVNTQLAARADIYVQYLSNGTTGWQGKAVIESNNSSGDVDGQETIEISFQANGALGAAT